MDTVRRSRGEGISDSPPAATRMGVERLIVFARYPEPGRTKTRLIPALGAEGAADLHEKMLVHTLVTARRLARRRSVSLEIRFEGGDAQKMRRRYGGDLRFRPQSDGHLGARMHNAFEEAFHEGAGCVLVIGTDCPEISVPLLHEAFTALRRHDVVMGPAADGGYTMIGLNRPVPALFPKLAWGSHTILRDSLKIAECEGLSVSLLPTLPDVDRPEDLPHWEGAKKHFLMKKGEHQGESIDLHSSSPRVSVILPVLNEERLIGRILSLLEPEGRVEVLVVDGGSLDGTRDIARSLGARVISSKPGRAIQMNAGAAETRGQILLFLHGDTALPPGFDAQAAGLLADPDMVAGAFTLRIAGRKNSRTLRWIDRTATWRSRLLRLPYGDQGIFLAAETFRQIGGFPELPVLEDVALMKRLRCLGRIGILEDPVWTSGRRWKQQGPWRTTILNQLIMLGFACGVAPERLVRLRRNRGAESRT